ncbi:MAG: sugar ABC transporter ATP-binding protein [Oscillospiraceae bacterium]|nr:sugar ABC transporter ATP-binding protein [Oscillospiraceae bacterium]
MVSALKTSEKQLLEICRALFSDAKLFVLDEPTTALSGDEVEHLFNILQQLKKQKKSIIFISHKMVEIFEISDRYTVLRNGRVISTGFIKDVTYHQVTLDMVGEQYVDKDEYTTRPLGDIVLSLKGFTGKDFQDVDLDVRKGEVVAFTGLTGSGASEVMQGMFGVLPVTKGFMEIKGKRIHSGIFSSMKNGVAMLPSNRKENSVVPDMNILENTYIAEHSISWKNQFIAEKNELVKYRNFIDMFRIKAETPYHPINSLSGGNQQKIFLARWLYIGADILLFDNPTQGVDVGAKAEIYKLILEFASEGKTVIINTLEIPEIKKVSDRCAVFYEGKLTKIFTHDEINEHDVMLYSTNAVKTQKGADAL